MPVPWALLCTMTLVFLTLDRSVACGENDAKVIGVLQTALSELMTTPIVQYGNVTYSALKALGLKDTTIEYLKGTFQGSLTLLRPLAQPVFRFAGVVLVIIHFFRSVLPPPFNQYLPQASSLTGLMGDVATELGLGALAEELHVHNFAGPQYSTTWMSWMQSCHSRALCDLGHYVARQFPFLVPFVDIVGPPLGFSGSLLSHLKSGLQTETSCGDIYINCPHVTEFYSTY